jgi:hypothetical protein
MYGMNFMSKLFILKEIINRSKTSSRLSFNTKVELKKIYMHGYMMFIGIFMWVCRFVPNEC